MKPRLPQHTRKRQHVARSIPTEIVAALARGPMHLNQIASALGREYSQVSGALRALRESGRVIVVGRCGPMGFGDVRVDAPVYALAGATVAPLKAMAKATPSNGSGVWPEPCREREFRELKRDIWAHMRLCMETRK
jgi:DNA-binding transcriptional ArsR family regulator